MLAGLRWQRRSRPSRSRCSQSGNARVRQHVTVPSRCLTPVLLVHPNGGAGAYIAATGFTSELEGSQTSPSRPGRARPAPASSTASASTDSSSPVFGDQPQRRRAPLAERALERALLPQRLVAASARRACVARAGRCRSAGCVRDRPSRRGPSAPARAAAVEARAGALLHAADVHVLGQHVAAEREARDRIRGVAADAGQLRQVVRPAVRCDLLRGALEVECAPVVAEPLPLADDVRRLCRGERVDRRPPLEPGQPARDDARRPASAAASPRRRGSRTGRASDARADRVRARRTSAGAPPSRARP